MSKLPKAGDIKPEQMPCSEWLEMLLMGIRANLRCAQMGLGDDDAIGASIELAEAALEALRAEHPELIVD